MSRVEFDQTLAREVLASTLLQVLTTEKKDEMLRSATIEVLERKDKDTYNSPVSNLERIFKDVVSQMAKERIVELLKTDENLKRQLDQITTELMAESLKKMRETLVDFFVKGMEKAMTGRGW